MDHSEFVNTSLRLRYEVFSAFTTQVNQAKSLDEVGEAIAAHIKFVLDAFVFRLATQIDQEVHCFELFRGQPSVSIATAFNEFEQQCLTRALPLTLSVQEIQQETKLRDSLFDHPKVMHLMVLPFHTSSDQPLILSIANKSDTAYTELDFRFARLIEELLSTKISQLLLLRKIASKNLALEHANQQLSVLNQEVHILNNELETKVEERTSRLQEAHEELNTLLYRTSHDFRRPLTSIMGLIQLLGINSNKEEAVGIVQHLETTVVELDTMLIKLQKLNIDETEDEPTAIDFSNLLAAVQDTHCQELAERNIQLLYQVDEQQTYYSYTTILTAILDSLVENAIQYHSFSDPFVKIRVYNNDKRIMIRVSDNGTGIPKDLQPNVFDMYYRGSERSKGNGLGLFIAKKLTTKLGGEIDVVSTEGIGSEFTLSLPHTEGCGRAE